MSTDRIARVAEAVLKKDITGLNLKERRMVLRHALMQRGFRGDDLHLLVSLPPVPVLRKMGFKSKVR